jgi:AraC-like DNA-binding protein
MTESFNFTTAPFPAPEAFFRYRDLYSQGADAVEIGPNVAAEVRGWRLDRMLIFDRRLSGIGAERSASRVRRDQFDHFTLQLNRGGEFHGEGAAGFHAVAPGELILMDMTKPMRTRMPDAHLVSVSLSRDLVEAAANTTDRLHGLVLPKAASALLADFLVSLTEHAADLPAEARPAAARTLVELLRVALGPDQSLSEPARAQLDALRLDGARRFIDGNLADDRLGPDTVASALNISRATIYRVFEHEGGVARHIQTRRLSKLRSTLANPAEMRSFAALALEVGFVSESHASRVFQQSFHIRPADFRREIRASASSDYGQVAALSKRKFISWFAALR